MPSRSPGWHFSMTWGHWRGTGQAFRSRSLFFAYLIAAVERCRCNDAAYPLLSKENFQVGYAFFESWGGPFVVSGMLHFLLVPSCSALRMASCALSKSGSNSVLFR